MNNIRFGGIPQKLSLEGNTLILSDGGGNGDSNMLRFQFTDPVPTDRDIGDIRVSSISYLTSEPWPNVLP